MQAQQMSNNGVRTTQRNYVYRDAWKILLSGKKIWILWSWYENINLVFSLSWVMFLLME